MTSGFLHDLLRIAALALLLGFPATGGASPEHPNRAEVMDIYLAMDFRNAMIDDPEDVAAKARTHAARASLQAMNAAMEEWGSGPDGWRYLMGASVYAATGVGAAQTFVMFYNPWVDTAVITEWQYLPESLELIDLEWLPGDLLRGSEIDPLPAWQRAGAHPSIAMISALAATVDAFEAKFDNPAFVANWRRGLGVENREDVAEFLSPLIALRVFENQMRLQAIEYSAVEEDPLFQPLREAVVAFIVTAVTDGFSPLLEQASRTPPDLADVIAQIQPETMQGLAPVAYIADDDEVLVYFASPLTADFVLSAVYERHSAALRLRVLDFVPYAASYQAVNAGVGPIPQPEPEPQAIPSPQPTTPPAGSAGSYKVTDPKKK